MEENRTGLGKMVQAVLVVQVVLVDLAHPVVLLLLVQVDREVPELLAGQEIPEVLMDQGVRHYLVVLDNLLVLEARAVLEVQDNHPYLKILKGLGVQVE